MCTVSPRIKKKGGGGGVEHLEAVYVWAHTLLAYTTILCCVNTVKRRVLRPLPLFGGNTDVCHYPGGCDCVLNGLLIITNIVQCSQPVKQTLGLYFPL